MDRTEVSILGVTLFEDWGGGGGGGCIFGASIDDTMHANLGGGLIAYFNIFRRSFLSSLDLTISCFCK